MTAMAQKEGQNIYIFHVDEVEDPDYGYLRRPMGFDFRKQSSYYSDDTRVYQEPGKDLFFLWMYSIYIKGYRLEGWYDSKGEKVVFKDEYLMNITAPDHDETYTANIIYDTIPPTHKITFLKDANVGLFSYYDDNLKSTVRENEKVVMEVADGTYFKLPGLQDFPTGYGFDHWTDSKGRILTNEMYYSSYGTRNALDRDETFTAHIIYNPGAPNLPGDSLDYKARYRLTLKGEPAYRLSGASVSTSGSSIQEQPDKSYLCVEGAKIWYSFYIGNDYHIDCVKDEEGNVYDQGYAVMPNHDLTLTAYISDPNPASPQVPGTNAYDEDNSTMIIDQFSPNSMWYTLNKCLEDIRATTFKRLIVNAPIAYNDLRVPNDWNSHGYKVVLQSADFSRCTGTNILSQASITCATLEELKLPACIDSIDYRAFYNYYCEDGPNGKELALKELTLFSKTPPRVYEDSTRWSGEYNSLYFLPKSCIVRVPGASLNLYRKAKGWRDFMILPITDDVVKVTVRFPEGTDMSLYRDMQLEIRNTKSGEGTSYVINDRSQYIFSEVIKQATYEIFLRNRQGQLFGHCDAMRIENSDVEVILADLLKPMNASVSVWATEEGQQTEVTDRVNVLWLDENGNTVTAGAARS